MKSLLYISANSKPESSSVSRQVSRKFVDEFLSRNLGYDLIELDLYSEHIPEITHRLFSARGELINETNFDKLSRDDKENIRIVTQLCEQFMECDVYVIAAPMWSLLFPARLKTYIDCIMQHEKLIRITPEESKGLLDAKERKMVYIQSSGGKYSSIFTSKLNYGVHYLHDIFNFVGIKKFETILIENTGFTEEEDYNSIKKAYTDIDKIINKF